MEPAQESFIITVPPIACSFPWKIHPDSQKLKDLSDAWLVECCKSMPAACKSERAASYFSPGHLINSATHLLAMLFFPNASSTHLLRPIVKLLSWSFMVDNFLDDPNEMGADPVRAKRVVDSIVAVFKLPGADLAEVSQHQGEDEGIIHSLTDSAKEWWEDLCLYMTPSQQARFSALFVEYVHSNHAEVCVRASSHPPDLQTYMQIRSASIGWYPLSVLTECCLGIELDAEVLAHPLLILLKQNVCENIILVNDIVSFGKEYMQGDLFNLVFVLCFNNLHTYDPSCDVAKGKLALLSKEMLQQGVFQVSEMIKERDSECMRIMEEIKGSPFLMSKPGMEAYMQGLGLFLGGNLYWHLVSARYGLSAPPSAPTQTHIMQVPNLLIPHHLQLSCPS